MGRIGDRKREACKQALKDYFSRFGDDFSEPKKARCQAHGGLFEKLDPAHKIRRSRGGNEEPDNLLALCRRCHTFLDAKAARVSYLEKEKASMANGLMMAMPAEIKENLFEYLETGIDKFSWR